MEEMKVVIVGRGGGADDHHVGDAPSNRTTGNPHLIVVLLYRKELGGAEITLRFHYYIGLTH